MSTIHVLSRAYESIYAQCIEIYAHSRRDHVYNMHEMYEIRSVSRRDL